MWSSWSPPIISWPDRHRWAAKASTVPARIVSLIELHPHAAAALAVPATLIGIASVAAYPFVFVALLVLAGVALVVMDMYAMGQTEAQQRTQVAAVAEKRNHQQRADLTRSLVEHARAQAEPNGSGVVVAASPKLDLMKRLVSGERDPGTQFIGPRLELETEARAAEALAAKAEALALEARVRAIRLRLKADARAN
jgi:colicin import membrane protein